MTTETHELPVWTAMAAAALMMAHQVAGKTLRDALFLETHSAQALPAMVMAAAVVSVALGVMSSHLFRRLSPARVVPYGFVLSGVLQWAEYGMMGRSAEWGSVVVYLHTVAFAAVLLSSFWLLLSEQMNPQEAKRRYGRIAGLGTAGSVAGGMMAASWNDRWFGGGDATLLLGLGAMHVVCGVVLMGTRKTTAAVEVAPMAWVSPKKALRSAPHLGYLAVLVALGTASAATLDFVYKSKATAALGPGELREFFGWFNTAVAVASFGIQVLVSRASLERLGVSKTVGALPLGVAVASGAGLAMPVFPLLAGARGVESTLRGSLFRAGYELMYSPIPPQEKRAAKTVIDVGCDRLGEAAGALVCQASLVLAAEPRASVLLAVTAALAVANGWVARQLDRVYVAVVERGLLNRAADLHLSGLGDWTVDPELLESRAVIAPIVPHLAKEKPVAQEAGDAVVRRMAALRSGDAARVRGALESGPLEVELLGQAINLLAWDAVAGAARAALHAACGRATGQLVDRLVDGQSEFAIRRRIPSILVACEDRRAVDGLMAGLRDERFEVRYRCARALDVLVERRPQWRPVRIEVEVAIERELAVDEAMWRSRTLVDEAQSSDSVPFLDDVLRERADRSLEHLFSLLALILPREPLKASFRSLHSDDAMLRSLALEYLDGVVPQSVRDRLRVHLRHQAG